MQRKGYNVVNKTGYKRNGKGKKKRARKEIEINSPKKKKVQLMHIREKQKRCLCLTILICLGQVQTLNFSWAEPDTLNQAHEKFGGRNN